MTDPMRNASERDRLTPLLDFEVEPPIGRISAAISLDHSPGGLAASGGQPW
jgi:hypothetical protein